MHEIHLLIVTVINEQRMLHLQAQMQQLTEEFMELFLVQCAILATTAERWQALGVSWDLVPFNTNHILLTIKVYNLTLHLWTTSKTDEQVKSKKSDLAIWFAMISHAY